MRIVLTADQVASRKAEQKAFRDSLPKGKVSVKWIQLSAGWQVYKGRNRIAGCSGSSENEALEQYLFSLGDITDEEKKQYL